MKKNNIITLSSDFGLQDEYVGVMKGAILCRNPECTIIDLHHHLTATNMKGAGILLHSSLPYFPPGTIHIIVVDPGVGSNRKIILASSKEHFFLAPDNGIIPAILTNKIDTSYIVNCPELYNQPVSNTFHGRDIMAPVAAHLSKGVEPIQIGPAISPADLYQLPDTVQQADAHQLQGTIVYTDHFGNMLTDIKAAAFDQFRTNNKQKELHLSINEQQLPIDIANTYSDISAPSLLLINGSRGYMEISINGRNAAANLNCSSGDTFFLLPKTHNETAQGIPE